MTTASVTRAAFPTPSTVDEATRSVELLIATEAPINGVILRCQPDAVITADAPIPVLMSHRNAMDAMAGRLGPLRFDNGRILARAYFDSAPAADEGWAAAKAGCAVSVGAQFSPDALQDRGASEVVTKWRLTECSLVPAGADPQALVRSAAPVQPLQPVPMNDTQSTAAQAETTDPAELQLQRQAEKIELTIRRAASSAKLPAELTDRLVEEHRTSTETEALTAVVRELRLATEERAPAHAGHPARVPLQSNTEPAGLEGVIHRALRGERLDQPLWLHLRAAGFRGTDAVSVWRSALSGKGSRFIERGFLSTSDLPELLTASGDRRLMERFQVADAGIRTAASVRQLGDYRSATVADVGMVGTAQKILEGGEITFASVNEAAASYQPSRYGLGLSFTPEALANDDLSALDEAIAEMAAAMLDAEATALVDLLEGAANGRNAPDGLALFHADHSNTVSAGPLGIGTIGSAVELMRNQKALGGRYIAQEPAVLLVPTASETTARQLLSDAINAAQSDAINPWRNLEIAVEPRLSGTYFYVIGNSRRPLELGRLTAGPVMTTETEFKTSAYRAKVEHAFGCIVQEFRSIVRVPVAGE